VSKNFLYLSLSSFETLISILRFFVFFLVLEQRLELRPRPTPAVLWRRAGPPFPLVLVPLPAPPLPSSVPSPVLVMASLLARHPGFLAHTTIPERVLNARYFIFSKIFVFSDLCE
jgi:hypothetical protein